MQKEKINVKELVNTFYRNGLMMDNIIEPLVAHLYLEMEDKNPKLVKIALNILNNSNPRVVQILKDSNVLFDNNESLNDLVRTILDRRKLAFDDSLNSIIYKLLKLDESKSSVMVMSIKNFDFLLHLTGKNKNNAFTFYELLINNLDFLTLLKGLYRIPGEIVRTELLPSVDKKFDKAFILPPMGMMIKNYVNYQRMNKPYFNKRISSEWLYVDEVLDNMNPDGRAVVLLPSKCLFNSNDKDYREYLINNGYLEAIIELPANTLYDTSVVTYLLVLDKNNQNSYTKILDANEFINKTKTTRTSIVFNVNDFMNAYESESIKTISSDELVKKDDLRVNVLMMKPLRIKDSKILSDITSIIQGSQYTLSNFKNVISEEKTDYCLITSSDLENSMIMWDKVNYIEPDEKLVKFAVHKGDMIMTAKSSKVKMVVVDIEPDMNAIVTGGMFIIRANRDVLNMSYLKMFLESNTGQMLLKKIQKGSVIPVITLKAIKELEVSCPDIEIQNRLAKKYESKLMMYAAMKQELEELEAKINSFYDDEIGDDC